MNHIHDQTGSESVARTTPTEETAIEALNLWFVPNSRMTRPATALLQDHWCTVPPTLLQYTSGPQAHVSPPVLESLNQACRFLQDEQASLQRLALVLGNATTDPQKPQPREGRRQQMLCLARGLCHAVRAVVAVPTPSESTSTPVKLSSGFRQWQPGKSQADDFVAAFEDLRIVFESYHAAWGLVSEPVQVQLNQLPREHAPDRATEILDHFTSRQAPGTPPDWLTKANWLIVRRLLSYLLTPDDSPEIVGRTNRLHLLATVSPDVKGESRGTTLAATTTAQREGHSALYLDPVLCGLLPLDEDMRSSLQIAGWLSTNELKSRHGNLDVSLRLAFDEHTRPPMALNGNSGGGLLIASSVATARNTPLDHATATFAVVPVDEDARKRLQVLPHSLKVDDFQIASVGGVLAKLTNNESLKLLKISRVFLFAGQHAEGGRLKWDDLVRSVGNTGLTLVPVGSHSSDGKTTTATLAQFIDAMTGDHRKERVLDAFCDHQHQQWQKRRPSAFVEFRFGRLPDKDEPIETEERLARRGQDSKSEESSTYKPVTDKKDATAEDQLQALLALGPRICLTEDAGAGKTMASHRLLHSLTDRTRLTRENQRSPLVARFEPREHNWPSDLRQSLMDDLIQSGCLPSGPDAVTAAEVVDYAIQKNRLILIFDAFDQVYDGPSAVKNRTELLQSIWAFFNQYQCRVIVTSRVFAVRPETSTTYFPRNEWKFATIFGFNEAEQTDYLRQAGKLRSNQKVADLFQGVAGGQSENIYQRDAEIRRLLSVPNNLNLLRELPDDQIRRIRNRFDLYQKFHQQQLNRATKDGSSLDSRKCHLMLAAAGFQMMVDEHWNYSLLDDQAETLEHRVDERCRLQGYTLTDEDWTQLKTWSQLTNHGILDDIGSKGTRRAISWKHRGWMEYFAARYLTLFASENETEESRKHNGESNWHWTWRFVLEAPLAECTDDRWQRAVTLLFSPVPDKYKPKQNEQTKRIERELILRPRPTELMFRAWQVMERGLLDVDRMWNVRDAVLGAYRQQFVGILTGSDEDRAERAAELITEADFDKHLASRSPSSSCSPLPPGEGPGVRAAPPNDSALPNAWLQRMRQMYAARPTYKLCSDATKPEAFRQASDPATREREYTDPAKLTFRMGASPEDDSAGNAEKYDASNKETWWIEQRIAAFQMATCCVTRAQYRLFDPHREQNQLLGDFGINERSPDEDCPITHVDWWDAFCFGLWLGEGYQLPTEMQWEGAAWGGIERAAHREAVVSVPPYQKGFTTDHVNYSGKETWNDSKPQHTPAERTLPVRWDLDRLQRGLRKPAPRTPNAYKANGFGLWQVNGNVWEWCLSGWADTLREAIEGASQDIAREDMNAGTRRVVRGGSWDFIAGYSRTSDRYRSDAEARYYGMGFRLSRTF